MFVFLLTDIPDNNEAVNFNGNEILFNFLIDNLKSFHHHEILFTLEDSYVFPFLVHHRDRDLLENPVPFPHPEVKTNLSTVIQGLLFENCKRCSLNDCPLSEILHPTHNLLTHEPDFKDGQLAKWKCFVKGCSPSLVIFTIVPASFDDLKKLYIRNTSVPGNNPELQETDISLDDQSENPEDEMFSKEVDQVVDMDVNNVHDQENANNKNLNSELLYIPLYVYNGLSSSIINQLVSSNHCEKNDNFMKFVFEYENCVDDQSNVSSAQVITPSQLSEESEIQTKKSKKDSHYFHLKDHCSLIEKSHAKAFVYSVYKYVNSVFLYFCKCVLDFSFLVKLANLHLLTALLYKFLYYLSGDCISFMHYSSVLFFSRLEFLFFQIEVSTFQNRN